MDLFCESQTQEVLRWRRSIFYIVRQTKSLRTEVYAVRLVGSAGYRSPGYTVTSNNWTALICIHVNVEIGPKLKQNETPIGHARPEQHVDSYEDVRKWLIAWFALEGSDSQIVRK